MRRDGYIENTASYYWNRYGFPTLKHIKHVAQLHKSSVRVFEQASRGDNMILSLLDQGRPEVRDVAQALIGSEVWVGWPHLVEAKVRFVVEIISNLEWKGWL